MYDIGDPQSDRGSGARDRSAAKGTELEETIRKRVENSSIERIKTNVPKGDWDAILAYDLAGVKVDEDYRRYYPYDSLASKVIGFTGGDNQGIVGLEVRYDEWLAGQTARS